VPPTLLQTRVAEASRLELARAPGPLFAFALASISLIVPLAVHLFIPAIPAVKTALGLSDSVAQLTFSIALFSMAFATLFYGSLSDRYGRRPVLLSGLCLFLAGSAISAGASSVTVLVLGRLVQAVGAGCGITLVRAIAQDVYGPSRVVKAIAYLTMAYTLGPMISPMIGGILVDALGWRSVFGFALAAGGAIALGAYLAVFETRPQQSVSRTSGSVPESYLTLLWHPRFAAFVLQTGFCSGSFLVVATAASGLMKEMLHRPSAEYGMYFLLFPFGFLAGSFVTSRIGSRAANEPMVLAGSLLSLAAVLGQAILLLSDHVTPLTLFGPGFFISMAQGLSMSYAQAAAMAINPKLAGTAAGMGVFTQNFVGAFFAQLYGILADGTPGPLVQATLTSAVLGLAAGGMPFLIRQRQGPATKCDNSPTEARHGRLPPCDPQ
jgi:MFS transporter, DHA1 family, multidrug resistance protein